ncbi:MAG: DUF3568 family protein [Candidatus Omnitrophica bacterium]|nr:DUF3568 family protein [Candidatus Omnitrophota bacterium]
MTTSGCALALVGAGAAAGTYAMVQGSAEGFSDAKYDRIWKAAKAVLEEKGTLTSDDEAGGVLKGKVADTDVTVELVKITEASTKMRVTARKNLLPREKLAEEVYTAIAKKL